MLAPALIVFAKAPVPGRVKTRLTALLSEQEAARLYEAFLEDTLAQYAALAAKRAVALRLYHAGPRWPEHLMPEAFSLHRQRAGGLGARMAAAFRETFETGRPSALIVGTDHPTLPPSFIEKGMDTLQARPERVCIGPAADGGFYLLGMHRDRAPRLVRALFEGMRYSHDSVFAETLARAAGAGAQPTVLPEWYDVDTPADLRRLAAGAAPPGQDPQGAFARAPRTHECLQGLLEKYPTLRPGQRP